MKTLLSILCLSLFQLLASAAAPLVATNATWTLWDKATAVDDRWKASDFDDASWKKGEGRFGYGGDGEKTVTDFGSDAQNKTVTTYFRHSFEVADKTGIEKLRIRLIRDDGAVIYLNGKEVARSNMPEGEIKSGTMASGKASAQDEQTFIDFVIDAKDLKTGKNLFAVEIHQSDLGSSDLGFLMEVLKEDSK